jgi:predicted GTPase
MCLLLTPQSVKEQFSAILQHKLPPPLKAANMLLLGPAGAGKSSLVSTLDSLLKGDLTRRAAYGGSTTSLTTTLKRYTFTAGPTKLPLALWDTRGWCPASYHTGIHDVLASMLDKFVRHSVLSASTCI